MVAKATAPRRENVPRHILFLGQDHGHHGDWMDKHLTFVPVMKKA